MNQKKKRGKPPGSFNMTRYNKVKNKIINSGKEGIWINELARETQVKGGQLYRYLRSMERDGSISREPETVQGFGVETQRIVRVRWLG